MKTYVSNFWIVEPPRRGGGMYCLHAYTSQREARFHMGLQFSGVVHLDTVQLFTATYSDRCVQIFYCSSAVNGSYLIEMCSIKRHPQLSIKRSLIKI